MAVLALPALGAAVGWGVAGTAMAAQIGWMAGSLLNSVVGGPRRGRPTIQESGVQTTQEGAPIPIVYGTGPVTGNVIAAGPMRKVETPIKQRKGGSKTVGTEVSYFCTYAVEICEGPIGGLLMVKRDGKIVFDARPGSNFGADNAAFLSKCTIYLGTEDQMPDPNLEAIFGAGEVPAQRGIAYIVFKDSDCTARGGSLSQWEFLVTSQPVYSPPDETFTYTGSIQTYTVPAGVTRIYVKAWGGGGVGGRYRPSAEVLHLYGLGGGGGFVQGWIDVTPGQVLQIIVGGGAQHGIDVPGAFPNRQTPGIPGWANGSRNYSGGLGSARNDSPAGGSGGGASAVILNDSPWTQLLVAGAGAGSGCNTSGSSANMNGAPGGGVNAQYDDKTASADGRPWGGGGTQTRGGYVGDPSGAAQPSGNAGGAGDLGDPPSYLACGGGGGGGYFGGGGGAGNSDLDAGGGGGGSSLVPLDGSQEPGDGAMPGGMDQPEWSGYGVGTLGEINAGNGAIFFFLSYSNDAGTAPLSGIVADIHKRCGADLPVVVELETIVVKGLVIASPNYTGSDVIDMLRGLYMFDRVARDSQVHYELRGKPPVATITDDDLVDEEENTSREAPLMFPRKLLLTCLNPNANYETSTVSSARYSPDVRVEGEQSVSFPVVMDEAEATMRASILHKVAWAEAEGEVNFSLPYKWIWLTPGECVTFKGRRVRIDDEETSDFVLAKKCRVDRASAYNASPVYIPLVPPEPPISSVPGDTTLAVLDIPAIIDQDDALVMRLAVTGDMPGWGGAVVQRSVDDGETYSDVISIGASVIGALIDAIPSASEHYTDTTNQVRVQLIREGQELNPISETAFLSEGGAFALQKPDGSWELMQYLDAEDEGDGVFLLTTLHRGILNSKPSAHDEGALFVLLSDTIAVSAQSTWLGMDLTHRAPSVGQVPEEADAQTAEYVGRSQREWPVYLLGLDRAGDTVSGSWLPRHRFGGDVNPLASINFEGYRVTMDDGAVTEVLTVTDPNFTFDASGMDTPLSVSIAALNRITGPGEAVTEEI